MVSIPPHRMEMRLHDKTPNSPCTAEPETEYRIVLFEVECLPPLLRFVHQVRNFMPVVHLVTGL